MSGNSNASIEKIKLTILEIQEGTSGDTSTVDVTLKKGDEAGVVPSAGGDVPVYLGKMKYDDGCDKTKIDGVQAVFSADEGASGDTGKVNLKVTLTKKNTFISPLVTTVPTDTSATPMHCIEVVADGDDSIIVTFLEPNEGEFVSYPAIYFHTVQGVIDPGFSVRRPV